MQAAGDDPRLAGSSPSPVVLRVVPGDNETRLLFAARVLLEVFAPDVAPRVVQAADSEATGLELPGGVIVSRATLYEIFASVTLERELRTGKRDPLDRFDETAIDWDLSTPWVDLVAQQFATCALDEEKAPKATRARFSVHITHDADRTTFFEPFALTKSFAAFGMKQAGVPRLRTALAPKVLLKGLERVLTFEREMGIGAWFFMMSEPFGLGRHASKTDPRWASWKAYARLVQEAGMGIGLHSSYAAKDRDSYSEEREALEQAVGQPVTTHRSHYLRFDTTRICTQLHSAGIEYDYSFGYSAHVGFRSGCARIHRTFDLANQVESSVRAVPLLFMDSNLAGERAAALRQLEIALDYVKEVGGTVSLLFHPELLAADLDAWPSFEQAVRLCRDMGADLSGTLNGGRPADRAARGTART